MESSAPTSREGRRGWIRIFYTIAAKALAERFKFIRWCWARADRRWTMILRARLAQFGAGLVFKNMPLVGLVT
jgi:hypothetical protein